MPHSLKVRLKNLQRKGELTEKDIDRIFKALEQEPCDDVVSRQAVLDLIEHYNSDGLGSVFYGHEEGVKFANAVNKLPSVRPQEQTGHWIVRDDLCSVRYYQCSECNEMGFYDTDFCPNCGAKMVEPQESEDKE